MHDNVKNEFKKWYEENTKNKQDFKIAELGSYDINGSIRDIVSKLVGFDIYDGKNVDVVIKPGEIPLEYKNKYEAVVSMGSFQCCPYPELYKKEILDLLYNNGLLFLTMCGPQCKKWHITSPNKYGYKDCIRMTKEELIKLFLPEIKVVECYEKDGDIIFKGIKNE